MKTVFETQIEKKPKLLHYFNFIEKVQVNIKIADKNAKAIMHYKNFSFQFLI